MKLKLFVGAVVAFMVATVSQAQVLTDFQEVVKENPIQLPAFIVDAFRGKDFDYSLQAKPAGKAASGEQVMAKLYVANLKPHSMSARLGFVEGEIMMINGVRPGGLTVVEFFTKLAHAIAIKKKDREVMKFVIVVRGEPVARNVFVPLPDANTLLKPAPAATITVASVNE